ncbi:RNA polymerase sigma factor [Promicromonospora sukumoe]|uniref:RNA polymerase sigma factor n=1 Tax=Promicromonospora sukumoe TaxID=88382 RepID=UPI0037C5C572
MTTLRSLPDGDPPSDEDRITELWRAYAWRVQAYALRHVEPHDAQEVVSETFLVAWRRMASVPGDPLPWLLVVARNVVRNQRRAARRRSAAEGELVRLARVARAAEDTVVTVSRRDSMIAALLRLAPADAARVAGCSVAAFKMRLSRARRRLEAESAELPTSSATGERRPNPGAGPAGAVTDPAARRAR